MTQHSIKIVTAVPQIAVLLFAGPIRMAAEALAYFEIGIYFLFLLMPLCKCFTEFLMVGWSLVGSSFF